MATQTLAQPIFKGNSVGPQPLMGGSEQPWIKETASQTYKAGDLVYWDSNGTIAICTNSSQAHNSAILGQATVDATGTTGHTTRVRPIRPNDVYMMNLYHTTAASAVGTDATVGAVKGIYLTSGGIWTVDLVNSVEGSGNTGGRVRIVGYPELGIDGQPNVITDIYAWVEVQFLQYSLDLTDSNPFVRVLQFV